MPYLCGSPKKQIWTATWSKAHMACHTKHAEGFCGQQCYPSVALMPGLAEERGHEIKALQQCEKGAGVTTEAPAARHSGACAALSTPVCLVWRASVSRPCVSPAQCCCR